MKPLTGRETFGETRFSAYDTGSIDLYIDEDGERGTNGEEGWEGKEIVFLFVFFSFGKKVKHFDLNDATLQHPF